MPDLTIAPDGHGEPTVWLGDPDDNPVAVLRKCDLAVEGRDEVWAAWEAFVGAESDAELVVPPTPRPDEMVQVVMRLYQAQAVLHARGLTLFPIPQRADSDDLPTFGVTLTAWTPAGDHE